MLDIETTGVDPLKEEVLQIAVLEMTFENGFWQKGKSFNFFQHTDREPETKFAQDHMREIYTRCKTEPFTDPQKVRESIIAFCEGCGVKSPGIYFCGWNAGIFDLPFLAHHKYLFPARYEGDRLVGDCHYRVYEISGALQFVANVRGTNETNPLIKEALKNAPKLVGSRHDALFDCERQLAILNGLIEIARNSYGTGI